MLEFLFKPTLTYAVENHGHEHAIASITPSVTSSILVQWEIIAFLGVIILFTFVFVKLLSRRAETVDILDHGNIRQFVKSNWYPNIFQIPALLLFIAIGSYLFFGPQEYGENPGSILVWTFWWAILPFSFILVGRLWCAICPFAWISDFVQKLFGRRKKIPLWLGKYSFWIVDIIFIVITWFDRVYGMTENPILTGTIFLGLFAGATICGFLYERRAFCRYVCFLGNVAGNYSMVAPLELVPKKAEICNNCKEKACFFGRGKQAGCPYYQVIPIKDGNRFCVLCANCIKACPNDNIALRVRPFGSDFWKKTFVRFEESFFAKILVGIVIIQNIGMLSLWDTLSNFLSTTTGITNEKILFTIIYFLTMSIPVGLMFLSSAFSAKVNKEKMIQNFARFGYAFIAVDLAGHLAHNLNHLIGEGKTILAAITGIFSGKVEQMVNSSILNTSTITALQYLILGLGVLGTFLITYSIAKKKAQTKMDIIKTMLPHLILLIGLMLLNFYIFSLPMHHRA